MLRIVERVRVDEVVARSVGVQIVAGQHEVERPVEARVEAQLAGDLRARTVGLVEGRHIARIAGDVAADEAQIGRPRKRQLARHRGEERRIIRRIGRTAAIGRVGDDRQERAFGNRHPRRVDPDAGDVVIALLRMGGVVVVAEHQSRIEPRGPGLLPRRRQVIVLRAIGRVEVGRDLARIGRVRNSRPEVSAPTSGRTDPGTAPQPRAACPQRPLPCPARTKRSRTGSNSD